MSDLDYKEFIAGKVADVKTSGFEVLPEALHPSLYPHQRDIVRWALRGGSRAVFASFGLGKTRMAIEIARQIINKEGGKALFVTPLGVRQEFTRKDGPAMGVGSPEYLLLFRKPQTEKSKAYSDVPVLKDKEMYGLGRWQIDADAIWKSNGVTLPPVEQLIKMANGHKGLAKIKDMLAEYFNANGYDYNKHVEVADALADANKLPKLFALLNPVPSEEYSETVWHDIVRMRTLNAKQYHDNKEQHVCPFQLDIVDRCIERWSNPGDLVYDPFGGIGSVPYRAVQMGRTAIATELNKTYWGDACSYLRSIDLAKRQQTLF